MKLEPLVRVRSIELREGHRAFVTFEEGTRKDIDLEPYLHGPIFEPVRRNPALFRAIKIQGGTIAWDNGADIDPDFATI